MTDPRIEAIRERHARTTPGEWDYDGEIVWRNVPEGDPEHHTGNWDVYAPGPEDDEYPEEPIIVGNINGQIASGRANAEFIAHAHQDIPYLLDQLALARTQARDDAMLMREACGLIEANNLRHDRLERIWYCDICDAEIADDGGAMRAAQACKTIQHIPDCIVTKLRTSADRADGGVG